MLNITSYKIEKFLAIVSYDIFTAKKITKLPAVQIFKRRVLLVSAY